MNFAGMFFKWSSKLVEEVPFLKKQIVKSIVFNERFLIAKKKKLKHNSSPAIVLMLQQNNEKDRCLGTWNVKLPI